MSKMTTNAQSNGSSSLEIAQSNQDLIVDKSRRKLRRWIIAGIIAAIVIGLVIAAIVLLVTKDKDSEKATAPTVPPPEEPAGPTLSLEDLLQGNLNPNLFNASWGSDNELLYIDSRGNLVRRSLLEPTSTARILLSAADPLLTSASGYDISADGKYLKVGHNFQKIYRHSFKGKFTIINLETNVRFELGSDVVTPTNPLLLFAAWSPVGNAIAFVFENNVYYVASADSPASVQITRDTGFVNNGVPDWVYEEEVFSSNKALWFSPDGNKLAYGRFDDTDVPLMVLPIYGEPGSLLFQYPRANIIKYPKVGTPNPRVSLHCVDLVNAFAQHTLDPPEYLSSAHPNPILSTVAWASDGTIVAIWMNRIQNNSAIMSYAISNTATTNETIAELSQPGGWLELFSAPVFSADGSEFALILSVDQGAALGSYRHVVKYSTRENAVQEPLTEGAFVVTEILGWNHDKNLIFYLANTPEDSGVQHLYSVSPADKRVTCISCGLKSKNSGKDCLYNSADFNEDLSYYALTCAGPDIPEIYLYSLEEKILDWDENVKLQEATKDKLLPELKRLSFEVDGGFRAQVIMKLPPNVDTSGATKYPMLVNVYAGPDSYQVVEKFNLDWGSYLAANKSIIYVAIDGRSSGLKGDKILFTSYRQLGTVEIADQINVTKQIQNSLPYVDKSRTAIWGWSYGGYASGMALATDTEDVFKCGMSVAPVTDWTLYDSIYTERFMSTPDDNPEGYQNSNLLEKYEGLRDKEYFLIHGTYDDNVHYQQSMMWAKVLEQRDILFRQLSYPDEDHGLGSVRPHLYHSLESFLDECFIEH